MAGAGNDALYVSTVVQTDDGAWVWNVRMGGNRVGRVETEVKDPFLALELAYDKFGPIYSDDEES